MKRVITTPKNRGQSEYILPMDVCPTMTLDIYNDKKKQWRKESFIISITLTGKQLKTDREIKINY